MLQDDDVSMPLVLHEEPPLAFLELNRPQRRNALSMQLRDALASAFDSLERDDRIRAVVLSGSGDCFSSGFDLQELAASELRALTHRALRFHQRIYTFSKPLVTAVSGFALAGGFDLALSGDTIVAAEDARLGRPEIQWGVNPLLSKLSQRIGMPRSVRLSLMGEILTAEQAHEIGLVDRVVSPSALLEAARQEASRLCVMPADAVAAVKRASQLVPGLPMQAALGCEFGLTAELLATNQLRDALNAHLSRARNRQS